MSNIYKYIILSSAFLFLSLSNTFSQEKEQKDSVQLSPFQGLMLEINVAPYIQYLFADNIQTHQANIQVNWKNKYFPVFQIGFATANKTTHNAGFKGNGFFTKMGVDFNLLKSKLKNKRLNNYALGGVMIGYSRFQYSLENQTIKDEYWGGSETVVANGIFDNKFWVELNAGLRVPIYKNIYMGWSVQRKFLITRDKEGEISSWYIPGFGKNNTSNWGFNYIIGYRF